MWFLAPVYAESLVSLVGGATWLPGGAPVALAFYCRFLPILASNGAVEAFVQTLADSDSMSAYSTSLIGFWVAFALSAWGLVGGIVQMGAAGMICAAMFNAALRLQWGACFAARFLNAGQSTPSFSFASAFSTDPVTWIVWIGAWFCTSQATSYVNALSMAQRKRDLANLGLGAVVGVSCMAVTAFRDRAFWRRLSELRRQM
jgi:hypothetical protein